MKIDAHTAEALTALGLKRCPSCLFNKGLEEFHNNKRTGQCSECKSCKSLRGKMDYRTKRELAFHNH